MKKLNYILMALVSVMAFTWTACDDEIEYTPAGSEGLDGVYFANDMASNIELSKDASSFDVQISRGSDAGSATVYLTVEADSATNAIFTIPDSVTFEEGNTVANISIAYNADALVYDEQYAFTISVPAEMASPYGNVSYSGVAVLPAPWVSLGMATVTDDFILPLFGYSPVTYQVEIQENQENPGMYRLVNMFGEAYGKACADAGIGMPYSTEELYIEINAQDPEGVYFGLQSTGVDLGYGVMEIASMGWYYMANGNSFDAVKNAGYMGTFADGIISFPVKGCLITDNDGTYYANQKGAFVVAFPGVTIADYSVEVAYAGRFVDPTGEVNTAIANVTLGDDVESAIVGMALSNDPNAVLSGMMDGSIEVKEITESGKVELALAEDGVYTIVAVSVAGGEMQEAAYASFEFTTGGSEWESLGIGTMTDGVVGPNFFTDETEAPFYGSWAVEIEQSTTKAGVYRLKNPYHAMFASYADASRNYYIEIDASNPDAVKVPLQETGLSLGSYGPVYWYSAGSYYIDNGVDEASIAAMNYFGKMENGVITFEAADYEAEFNGQMFWMIPEARENPLTTTYETIITLPTEGASTASVKVNSNREYTFVQNAKFEKTSTNWNLQHGIGASKFRMNK